VQGKFGERNNPWQLTASYTVLHCGMDLKKYQSVYITLSNGKTGLFSGPALVTDKDKENEIQVTDVRFSQPKDLPSDISFESIDTGN
jgi:hypothetical protein